MSVSYGTPLRSAWNRTVRLLFRPFRLETWFVLGFAAFLSEYLSDVAREGLQVTFRDDAGGPAGGALRSAAAFLLDPVWGPLAMLVAISALATLVLLLWIGSRGKFVFLDGVVNERAGIVEPWKRWAREGNSLFLWWLAFSVLAVALVVVVSLPVIPAILAAVANEDFRLLAIAGVLGWLAMMIPLGIAIAYVLLFLFQFVVPIMAIHRIGTVAAWGRFLALFRSRPGPFLLYGLMYLGLSLVVAVVVAAFGLATCCVGFLLVALPYVGSVLLLPAEVTLRGLGPDFLAQFGPEYSVFAAGGPVPPPPAAAPTSPSSSYMPPEPPAPPPPNTTSPAGPDSGPVPPGPPV